MKVVYHPRYAEIYASDPAAIPGRMEAILRELEREYDFIEPQAATEDDLRRVHTRNHIESIKRDKHLYDIACLAAGGAIKAARIALEGEASFGLLRPPGHHASPGDCWGFCYFNNVAVALARLQSEKLIENALILDFDLHFGDGTNNFFDGSVTEYFQPVGRGGQSFVEEIVNKFQQKKGYSILAVSAGFDRHVEDWGGQLATDDYRTIGKLVKEAAERNCKGRRFAVLEGGYNHNVLGKNVKAFLEGMD
ncbi:MAG: histone deacetylase family protein [Dehalococcoidia bacterium]|nr:histone deacetylase family protein [Dehalococcoidia bacterium]